MTDNDRPLEPERPSRGPNDQDEPVERGAVEPEAGREAPPVFGYPPTTPAPEPTPSAPQEAAARPRREVPPVTRESVPGPPPRYQDDEAPSRPYGAEDHPRRRNSVAIIAVAALIAFVVAAFAGVAGGFLGARLAANGDLPGARSVAGRIRVIPSETDEPIVAAAAAAVPSVVNIDVRAGRQQGGERGLPDEHPGVPMLGNGSGVAYKRADGGGTYIITNNHVIENAQRLTVRDESGQSAEAEVIGRDPETDIAVIRIDQDLPVMEAGDSSELVVGQTVVAIGSPFGLEHSVTSGVVSALGRSLPDFAGAPSDAYPLVDVIQTDAAINPGNSGGALVDMQGRLVGINTAIYSDTGASGGVGFAVPVNTAVRVADQLIEGGDITHPFLGVIGQTVTPEFAEEEGLSATEGAYVSDLTDGSGAKKSGLRPRDVITRVDDEPIRTMDDLILQVRRKQVGQTVTLKVVRGERTIDVEVEVGDKPDDLEAPERQESTPSP
jgi:putative serine protease PepD